MNLLDKESYRLLGQKEKLEENQEAQVNYVWEEYEITYSQALIDMPDELQERAEIKSAISNMKVKSDN